VQVAKHEGRGLLGRQRPQLSNEVRLHDLGRIRFSRAAQAPDHLADLIEALAPSMGEGDVQGDPVQPGLRRRFLLPALPGLERAQVALLGRILCGRRVA